LAQSARDFDQVDVDSGTAKFATVKFGGGVVADDSDIVGAEAPSLAGDEGGGDLAAREDLRAEHFDLGAEGGELGKSENSVGGVFADAEDVETRSAHRVVVQGIGRGEKNKES
jgi:hypothetical protein